MSNTAITFAPSFFTLNLSQGSGVELTSFIKNPSDEEIFFRIESKDIKISSLKSRSLEILENTLLTNPSQWVELPSQSFSVKPGVTGEYKFKVTPPSNAKIEEYYPVIIFKKLADRTDEQVYVSADFLAPIYVNILEDGENDYEGVNIEEFSVENKTVFYPWNDFKIVLDNKSNSYVYPRGRIQIYDNTGKRLSDTPTVNDKYEAILKNETLDLTLPWSDKNGFRSISPLGEYKATVEIYLDNNLSQSIKAETWFTVIPLGYFAFYAVVLLALFLLFRKIRKKFKRK